MSDDKMAPVVPIGTAPVEIIRHPSGRDLEEPQGFATWIVLRRTESTGTAGKESLEAAAADLGLSDLEAWHAAKAQVGTNAGVA